MTESESPHIRFATPSDLPSVQAIYSHARQTQQARGMEAWPTFPDASVLDEIDCSRIVCVESANGLAGIFSIAYDDAALWGSRERHEHVYLHRIAKSAEPRLTGLLDVVLAWATDHCGAMGRSGLRMDTWATNTALIALYKSRGFQVVDRVHVEHDARLPAQYQQNDFVLLEQRDARI